MRTRGARRPKRLFHAIIACGVTLTACGTQTVADDAGEAGEASDAAKDAHDSSVDAPSFPDAQSDAQQDDAYDPPDAASDVVNTIKPPPAIH